MATFCAALWSNFALPLTLVRAIIDIGRTLQIDVTAEGVETMEHAQILSSMGCKTLQGYALARPMPESQLATFLQRYRPLDLSGIAFKSA